MLYIHEIYKKQFKAESAKDAYLKACKFVAKTVISDKSKVEASKLVWDVTNTTDETGEGLPTYLLTLYYKFDDTLFKEQSCKACKEFHRSFFVNQDFNCSRCNKIGYEQNIRKKLSIGGEYIKEKLEDELGSI